MSTLKLNSCGTMTPDPWGPYSDWHDNALEKRREWMEMLGLDDAEIDEYCRQNLPANMDEELAQYNALIELQQIWDRINREEAAE